jgi:hypothetical protein
MISTSPFSLSVPYTTTGPGWVRLLFKPTRYHPKLLTAVSFSRLFNLSLSLSWVAGLAKPVRKVLRMIGVLSGWAPGGFCQGSQSYIWVTIISAQCEHLKNTHDRTMRMAKLGIAYTEAPSFTTVKNLSQFFILNSALLSTAA